MATLDITTSIITINYNGLKETCELIDSITFTDDIEVIVVDNGSKQDEASIIKSRYPQVKVIRSKQNLGFAGGNNLGIQAARGKYLFFINNDTILSPHTSCVPSVASEQSLSADFRHLINRLKSDEKIAIVCPKIRFAWTNNPIQFAGYTPLSKLTVRNRSIGFGEPDKGQYDMPHPTPYAHGAAMMVKREAIDKVGLMPECYFLYYEELDWSMMFTRAGYSIWYEPASTIYHKESRATGQNSPLRAYYLIRNRLLFAQRNIKKPQRYVTYAYLIGIVGLRDIFANLFKRRTAHVKATIKGVTDFFNAHFSSLTTIH